MIAGSKRLREGAVVAVMLVLALVALRMSARNPGELSTLDRGILGVVAPAQAALSTVARAIGGVAGRYAELTHVRSENDRLRSVGDIKDCWGCGTRRPPRPWRPA